MSSSYSSPPSSSPPPSLSPPPFSLPLPSQPHSPSPKHEPPLLLPRPESRPTSPPKKCLPLPWTHQETVALIQAYQEKWYSLKKGQLKAFQWEEVAVTVAVRCGFHEPSKTSTQCRHKIEKLRKRYRSDLQKRYPTNSWQYFELMDQMERGPMPLNARPIAVVKPFPNNSNSNIIAHGHDYGSLYSSSADYFNNDYSRGDSDYDSNEKLNTGYGLEAVTGNKWKRIDNIVRGNVNSGVRNSKAVAIEKGFSDARTRINVRVLKNPINGKQKQYYDGDDENDLDDDDDEEEGVGGMELAAEIRIFAEKFIGMEKRKIEMLRESETYQMEMEKKKMDMIVEAQSKIMDTIDRAFGAHKKAKVAQET